LAIAVLALSLSVALGQQRVEDKTVGHKVAEAKNAEAVDAGKPQTVVYLRGDAVGLHLNYVPSATQMPTVRGAFVRIDPEWVVLSRGGKEVLIPRGTVLMIESPQ
jgi:hypothetical protein